MLSIPITLQPFSKRCFDKKNPMKPAAPVTRYVLSISNSLFFNLMPPVKNWPLVPAKQVPGVHFFPYVFYLIRYAVCNYDVTNPFKLVQVVNDTGIEK